jgi:transposase
VQPGLDNAKKDDGRKRHIAVDATGLVLAVMITAASVQDRDAARPLLWNLSRCCTPVRLAWADAGSADKLATWAASLKIELEIVRKRDAHAFEVLLPRSWVVERTLCLDHRSPPLRPRLRTVARRPRGHGPVGHGHPDNPAPRHPEAVTTKSSTHLDVS